MNTKQIKTPIVIGIISTTLCFSFGFFTDLYEYGINFLYAYIFFMLLLCYPMNVISLYLNKLSKNTSTLFNRSYLKKFSILFVWVVVVLASFAILNASALSMDILRTILQNNESLHPVVKTNIINIMYIFTAITFIITLLVYFLNYKFKLLFSILMKFGAYLILSLVIILMSVAVYKNYSNIGIQGLLTHKNVLTSNHIENILAMSFVYAILSSFVSLTFYKNVLGDFEYDIEKIRQISIFSVLFNIILSSTICIIIYSALLAQNITPHTFTSLSTSRILDIISNNSIEIYATLTIMFIIMNIIIMIAGIKYTSQVNKSLLARIIFLVAPFAIALCFIKFDVLSIHFVEIPALQLMITLVFLVDIFIIGWIYDAQKLSYDILKHASIRLSPLFNILLRIILPFVGFIITIGYMYPLTVVWQIAASICCLIVYIVVGTMLHKTLNRRKY